MKTVVVIPARYKSGRFPGKPLKKILGIPMVIRVAKIGKDAVGRENVYVATDDKRIKDIVIKYNYNTPNKCINIRPIWPDIRF